MTDVLDVVELINRGNSLKQVYEKLDTGVSYGRFIQRCHKQGVYPLTLSKFVDEKKDEIVWLMNLGCCLNRIGEYYHFNGKTFQKECMKRGFASRHRRINAPVDKVLEFHRLAKNGILPVEMNEKLGWMINDKTNRCQRLMKRFGYRWDKKRCEKILPINRVDKSKLSSSEKLAIACLRKKGKLYILRALAADYLLKSESGTYIIEVKTKYRNTTLESGILAVLYAKERLKLKGYHIDKMYVAFTQKTKMSMFPPSVMRYANQFKVGVVFIEDLRRRKL